MTAEQLFQKLSALDENADIEAKTASECGEPLRETVCAFANTDGGHILCGVRRKAGSLYPEYEVVGVPEPDQLQRDISTGCESAFSRPYAPLTRAEALGDKTVVIVEVAKLPPYPMPLHFRKLGFPKGVFLRRGSRNYQCSEHDIPDLLDHRRTHPFDQEPVPGASPDHLDGTAIAEYRAIRMDHDPQSDEHDDSDKDFLDGRCCFTECEAKSIPTTAGVLLFGKRRSVERFFPNARIEYVRVPGVEYVRDPGQDPNHRSITIVDPMVRTVDRVVNSCSTTCRG